ALDDWEEAQAERQQSLRQAIEDSVLVVNSAALDLCLARTRETMSCATFMSDAGSFFPRGLAECEGVFEGPLQGDVCSDDVECLDLGADSGCHEGECYVQPFHAEGEPCFRTSSLATSGRMGTHRESPDDFNSSAGQCLIQDGLFCKDGL